MSLIVVFLLLAFLFILFLMGGSLLMQGWLYQSPADRLPIRAVVGGLALAAFLTLWCWVDTRDPGKYDTLTEFSTEEVTDYDSFESVMTKQNKDEKNPDKWEVKKTTLFKKRAGSHGMTNDYFDDKGNSWLKNSSDAMTTAILIREKDKSEPTRFRANLDANGNFPVNKNTGLFSVAAELKYTDDAGRWMTGDKLGEVHRRKSGVLWANILLNAFHLVLWWLVLWLGMRFSVWHALGFAIVIWLPLMLLGQPVLFKQTRPTQTAWLQQQDRPTLALVAKSGAPRTLQAQNEAV